MARNGKCVSIKPDGTVDYFTPKPPKPRKELVKLHNGKYIIRDNRIR